MGRPGNDVFVFGGSSGADTIMDFTKHDTIAINGETYAGLTITYDDEGATITYGANSILVVGATSLTVDDFAF